VSFKDSRLIKMLVFQSESVASLRATVE